jgi:hypothetical protein
VPSPAAPDLQPWDGSWGSWAPGPGGDLEGGSVSISGCDAPSATCRLHFESESATTRCGTSRDAKLMVTAETTATGHFSDVDGKAKDCELVLTRSGSAAAPALQAHLDGSECAYFCTRGPLVPPELPRRSPRAFPAGWTRPCFADPRPSRVPWCLDDAVQTRDDALVHKASAIDGYLGHDDTGEVLKREREGILDRCAAVPDPHECLRDAYGRLAPAWALRLAEAKQGYEREQAALAAPGDAAQGAQLAKEIAGVYKHHFANAMVSGEAFASEEVLELVPVKASALYVRVHLEFFNGHTCDQWGVAHFASTGAFVYREPSAEGEGTAEPPACELQVVVGADAITLADPRHTCTTACGARGKLDGASFARSERRSIRYLDRLLRSQEYRDAVEEDAKQRPAGR